MTFLLGSLLCPALMAQQKWTLQQCVQRAEEKNLIVRNAQLNAELADRVHDQAFWSFLPNLNAGGTHGYNWGKTIDRYTNTFANDRVRTNNFWVGSEVSLYEGGRKRNTLKQTELDEEAARKGLEASRNDVRTEVVRGYLNVLGLRERIRTAETQVANSRDQITRSQALVDAGRIARAELLDINAQLANEEYTLTDLRNQEEQAMLTLGQQLRLEPSEMNAFDIEAPALGTLTIIEPTASEEDVLRNVLATNPAFAQADLSAQSAERGVSVARAGALPSLSFNASVGTGYSGRNVELVGDPVITEQLSGYTAGGEAVYSPSFDYATRTRPFGNQLDDNLNESVTLTLNVPIFNNKRNSLATDQARIRHEQAKNALEDRKLTLQRDVQNALIAQRNAFRKYESARHSVEASDESLRYAQERYAANAITAIELNTATLRAQQAQADMINAKYSYLMAQKSLDILQGLPLTL